MPKPKRKPGSGRKPLVTVQDIRQAIQDADLTPAALTPSGLYQLIGYQFGVWYSTARCSEILKRVYRP